MIGSLPSETSQAVLPRPDCINRSRLSLLFTFLRGESVSRPQRPFSDGMNRWLTRDRLGEVELIHPKALSVNGFIPVCNVLLQGFCAGHP